MSNLNSNLIEIPSPGSEAHRTASATMNTLRQTRHKLADWWITLPEELKPNYVERLGQVRKQLDDSGIRDTAPTEADNAFINRLLPYLAGNRDSPDVGRLVAAMFFLHPHQLPLNIDIQKIPPWLVNDYMKFTLNAPRMFREMGEADAYCRYAARWIDDLHNSILANPNIELWRNIGLFVTQALNAVPLYFNTSNLRNICRKRARIMEFVLQGLGNQLDYKFPVRPARPKLRLGLLALHFLPQTETFATLPAYRHLDRSCFEIILYSLQSTGHPLEQFCASHADRFVTLPQQLPQQVKAIRGDHLDLLLIATNVTAVTNGITCLALHRLAPVQIASVCSCVTTGMRNVDCYISGRLAEPASDAQSHYTERLFMVDGPAHCYDFGSEQLLPPTRAFVRKDFGISENTVVFISGANFFKIIPEMEEAWMCILAATPNSKLLLYPFNPNWASDYPVASFFDRLAAAMSRHGISPDRLLVFGVTLNRADILERLRFADIYLDSYPFSGATSLLDPLMVGLPAVVMDGSSFRTLVASSLLRELEVNELIATDSQSYIKLACRLASDRNLRMQLRERILQKMRGTPKFLDCKWYSAQVGLLLQKMWETRERPRETQTC